MIDHNEIRSAIEAFVERNRGRSAVGLSSTPGRLPSYESDLGVPPICACASGYAEVGRACREFYRALEEDSRTKGYDFCPYGFTVFFQKAGSVSNPIDLFALTDFDPSVGSRQVRSLPRLAKKNAARALTRMTSYRIETDTSPTSMAKSFQRLVDALQAGQVSDSIRGLSHEMLTPVQAVLSDVEVLERTLADSVHLDERTSPILSRLRRNTESVSEIAQKVALLLSNEPAFNKNRLRHVTVHAMVKQIAAKLRERAGERFIEINIGYNSGPLRVQAVPDQLEIVLSALMENAVKYSFSGSPEWSRSVTVSFVAEDEDLAIAIENDGCAIDEDEIEEGSIFQLGYRGRHSEDRSREGTGSGLYVAAKIVEMHGGEIWVQSDQRGESDGTRFAHNTFTLLWPQYQPE